MKPDTAAASLRSLLMVGVTFAASGCAHLDAERRPLALAERALVDACLPFVTENIGYAEVGRRLGGEWSRNFPDPFTPPAGPIFRNRDLSLQVVDGRQQRNPDGSLTSRPLRTCNVWMGRQDATALASMVRRAAAGYEARLVSADGDDAALQVHACITLSEGGAAVRSSTYADGSTGAGVYQFAPETVPAPCRPR